MKSLIIIGFVAAVALSGCAKSPSTIPPVAVSSSEYDGYSCAALRDEKNNVEIKLADASRRQNKAQTADAIGVFLVLVPVSKLTGDAAGDVGQYKGEKLAIEREMRQRKCS